jgi:hypothetical protein
MNPELLIPALTSHAPALVVGAVLCLIVGSAKLPAFATQWQRLPAWARPLVPVTLALVSGIGEALMQGQKWWIAILVQFGVALPAIGYALPSPVAHLDQVMLPDSPAVKRAASADELAEQVLANLDRPTDRSPPPAK